MSVTDPFRVVHRARRRRTLGLTLTGALAASALTAAVWLVPAAVAAPAQVVTSVEAQAAEPATPAPGETSTSATVEAPVSGDGATTAGAVTPATPAQGPMDGGAAPATQLAAPASPADQTSVPAPSTPAATAGPVGPRDYAVTIDTVGYQRELDRCLWVRMDLTGATAPIVGAHNNCGGEFVLDLLPGDTVTFAGQNLDGRYIVVDSRDGRPGQDAAEATADLSASVILQTCYFDGPDVRLVALTRVA